MLSLCSVDDMVDNEQSAECQEKELLRQQRSHFLKSARVSSLNEHPIT